MNILVAPDSFKESLSALEVSKTIKEAILKEMPNVQVNMYPMADGGEGILDTLVYATKGRLVEAVVSGPLGNKIYTEYGVLGDGKTVVIEIAKIAGLMQVSPSKRNPLNTTTYGIGEVIVHALERGYRKFIIGLGGSATNDGGLGMLQALGGLFLDEYGWEVPPFGASLMKLKKIDVSRLHPLLNKSDFVIASDVMNPLCGTKGATYVFGAQKGATELQMQQLDNAMKNYANLIETEFNQSYQNKEGAGAAGGLGFAFMLLGSRLQSGAELVAHTIGLKEAMKGAQWVITGEGKSDEQTMYGKVPVYIAKLAKEYNVKALLISGSLGKGYESLYEYFEACFSIINKPMPLEEAMNDAKELIFQQTRNIARMLS
ncbi:glycerate kinase [Pueribacillus sp. YX66]|uniref:glycerate kinase n=1 Tax=Pueribacillus sp. YX66 TaxID=3229242 RepID=UPI00358D3C20